ncbi:MAG: ribose-phosphate pyrophosphokinase [Deltaproteobacteria bacterium]|nr:ribose-phosphate pyrophosphokinase [Deltaproteobacteria bacterium]MBK7069706.1 ribose-phosphate pyrophosphokinase [Deltaproteobacteria bacterium]MBK8696079.1 ribose-phosphate pyrophosphokinase [Deltaproteobacteria bacterium]
MSRAISLFSGNANLALAGAIAHQLQVPLGRVKAGRFSDGEIAVEIGENVRGSETYLIQSTCAPVNDSIMEMLIMADALRRSSADSITAIMPYYGYARQDRKVAGRTPISAKLVADLITTAGVDRVLTVDLHAGQIQGFFNIPVDNLYAMPVLLDEIRALKLEEPVMVSPDAGGVERARAYAKRMNSTLAIIDKRRERANVSEVMHIIGDVKDRDCVLLDDMIDTAGTLTNAARALADAGARRVYAAATHAVLSGPAVHRIVDSPLVEVIVTDSIPLRGEAQGNPKFRQASLAKLLGEAIRRIHNSDSISSLFV